MIQETDVVCGLLSTMIFDMIREVFNVIYCLGIYTFGNCVHSLLLAVNELLAASELQFVCVCLIDISSGRRNGSILTVKALKV